MRRVYYLLLALIVFGMMYSSLQAWPYKARIVRALEISDPPYNPGIIAWFSLGPIEENWTAFNCFSDNCVAPPPVFYVTVEWASPNAPNCWVPMYGALLGAPDIIWGYGVPLGLPPYSIGGMTYLGQGTCGMLSPEGRFCWWDLRPGYNDFFIETGPLISGKYRIRTISINWPHWEYNYTLCENDDPNKMLEDPYFYVDDEKFVEVRDQCNDIMRVSEIYYINTSGTQRKTYNGGVLGVFPDYNSICMIQSTKKPGDMPHNITGTFYPEMMSEPTTKTFRRYPQLDYGQCDPEAMFRTYAYISEDPIRPFEFWDYGEEEWSSISRKLLCHFSWAGLLLDNTTDNNSITTIVCDNFVVKYLNDSTDCFIPAKPENGKFAVLIGDNCHVKNNTRIQFYISYPGDTTGDIIVYNTSFLYRDFTPDLNNYGLPDIPHHAIQVTWSGRCNQGASWGHLADPEHDPYKAYAIYTQDNNQDTSSADSAYVVPKIDSVFITHRPYWPPPSYGDSVTLYSIVKAKVDDAAVHPEPDTLNYHYYYPDSEDSMITLRRWARTNYLFRSADSIGFVEDNRARLVSPFLPWHTFNWGILHFKWFVTRDSATNTNGCNPAIYYYSVDTTEQWGDRWNPALKNNLGYEDHHRIYVTDTVINKRPQQYTIQTKATAGINEKAHKVIFGSTGNLCEIAETHLGTPYWMNNKKCHFESRDKKPYDWIDCSGFVTAIKIQDRGYELDTIYCLMSNSNVRTYVQGYYTRGNNRIYISDQIPESLVTEGDLVAMAPKPSKNVSDTAWSHIMLVIYCKMDNGKISSAIIIHAKGDANATNRKVRYDDLFEAFSTDKKVFKFLRYR
jgi:hypothetical protein